MAYTIRMQLDEELIHLKGVGPKTAEQFLAAGLHTVRDLIYFFPRAYEDFSKITTIATIRPGKVSLRGHFEDIRMKRVRRSMTITEATLVDATGKVAVLWFNQAYRVKQISADKEFLVAGEFGLQRNKYQVVNPSTELVEGDQISVGRIVPVYRQVAGLKTQLVRKVLVELKPYILALDETLPDEIVKSEKLINHADAVLELHFPESDAQLAKAKERFGFEELLGLVTASLLNRADNEALESHEILFNAEDAQAFVKNLPFSLTDAQRVAAWEAIQNLGSAKPMNRLLQGDVGSGKTVVAGLIAHIAAGNGFQTAFMAPTELLASQHAETLMKLLEPFETSVALLTGSVKGKARTELYAHISNGDVQVVVGTHALIQDTVKFHNLGFVVIDEQHRFGVEQRQKLLAKASVVDNDASRRLQREDEFLEFTSKNEAEGRVSPRRFMPHLLAMTATPIPRSLQLTVYGELDISILREKPANRLPILTEIISPNSRAQMYEKVEKEIRAGRQVYVICPLIDEQDRRSKTLGKLPQIAEKSEDKELKSVTTEYKRLQNSIFKHRKIGLLHGKLKSDEKQAVMLDFASGNTDILVSTTVVEVGVDVPNATVIIIEGADTFGLAQLHQLRGRVGRSELQSYCYLVPSTSQRPSRRLRELEKSNDGFYLAEKDLELRGPGEIYGRAQHGDLNLQMASIGDMQLLKRVKNAAEWLASKPDVLAKYPQLQDDIGKYRRLTTLN